MSGKCEECGRAYKNCICRFDTIVDVPEFLRRRVEAIDESRKSKIKIIQKTTFLFNHIMHNLPLQYMTRSWCKVEHSMKDYSEHDTARIMGVLLITEFNEILVNLYSGAHNSARRNVRSPLEWMVRVLAAVSDRQIFTKNPQDANKALCFQGLRETIGWEDLRRRKIRNKKYIERLKVPPDTDPEKAISFRSFLASANIPNGIKGIPERLNSDIMSNLQLCFNTQKITGSQRLYTIYENLSQSIHNTINKLDDVPHDGLTAFFDPESFDESYSLIHGATDVILCFYFILIDIDVYHDAVKDRKMYRKYVEELFAEFFNEREFFVCRTLFDSKVWNDPSLEFTCPRQGSS